MACGWPAPPAGGANRSSGPGGCGKNHRPWCCPQNSQKTAFIEYVFGSFEHSESPQIPSIHAGFRSFAGRTKDISQKCGDVTSNENRSARYSFLLELPEVFDRLAMAMPREQAMASLGQPAETQPSQKPGWFVDVYVLGADRVMLSYDKANKQLRAVGWNGTEVSLPRIQRADVFEAAGN